MRSWAPRITRSRSRIENASWIPLVESTRPHWGLELFRLPGSLTPAEEPSRPHNHGQRQAQYQAFGSRERILIVPPSRRAPRGILHVRNSLFSVRNRVLRSTTWPALNVGGRRAGTRWNRWDRGHVGSVWPRSPSHYSGEIRLMGGRSRAGEARYIAGRLALTGRASTRRV